MPKFMIHLLDVGAVDYGDSILCDFPGSTVLIDGGRTSSSRASADVVKGEDVSHRPLQEQIKEKLGQPIAAVDLLVVTHCHSDHMGCLPELVEKGVLKTKWALLSDPQLGYGITADSDEPPAFDRMTDRDKLWLALREEPVYGASDDEIRQFIEDTAKEYERYVGMVNKLQNELGSKCVLYRGPSEELSPGFNALLRNFQETGLRVYGPSESQLLHCAKFLEGRSEDTIDAVLPGGRGNVVAAYKDAISELVGTDAEDTGENGNAVNCQSIVLKFESASHKVLLTGDMQFAKPQLDDEVKKEVTKLLEDVAGDAPFTFVKLAHHGATNGQNLSFLKKLKAKMLGISTGSKSTKHPTEPTLQALESLGAQNVHWARVDMNGICSYVAKNGTATLDPERGDLDDLTRPDERSGDIVPVTKQAASTEPIVARRRLAEDGSFVDVSLRIPNRKTKVSFSIYIDPEGETPPFEPARPRIEVGDTGSKLAGGRKLPRLLFVSDPNQLSANVGTEASTRALDMVRNAAQNLELAQGSELLLRVQKALQRGRYEGVVLIGGYDVVPSQIVNTLPRELRQYRVADRDRLQVWSDDGYGDLNGDFVPELPVSRVPDAHDPQLLLTGLTTDGPGLPTNRVGIRNLMREFADGIFASLPGSNSLATSESKVVGVPPYSLDGDIAYLMLHGSAEDGREFLGEADDSSYPVALAVEDVPRSTAKVVFTGCCYGALTVGKRARDAQPGEQVPVRKVNESIALTWLRNGANAFVGCTGVHYSPVKPPFNYFGAPMHRLFWERLLKQDPPSKALYLAKTSYAKGIPFVKPPSVEGMAYEHKILRQYTCLGLGW